MPGLGDSKKIILISTNPKCLPRPYTNLIICSFYYSPRQNAYSRRSFHDRPHASLDFGNIKCPNAGIFIAGHSNELNLIICAKMRSKLLISLLQKVEPAWMLVAPTLKPFTILQLPFPLVVKHHFMLQLKPLLVFKTNYSVSKVSYRPITSQGLFDFESWITSESWDDVVSCVNRNSKVSFPQTSNCIAKMVMVTN